MSQSTKIDKSTWLSVGLFITLAGTIFFSGVMFNKVDNIEARLERANSNQRITTLETQFRSIESQLGKQSENINTILEILNNSK